MSLSKSRTASDEGPILSTAEMFIQLHSLSEHLPGIQAVARLAPTAQLIDELTTSGKTLLFQDALGINMEFQDITGTPVVS